MVRASHLILSTYGFWLPNDPRGSWSEFVGAWDLALTPGALQGVGGTIRYAEPFDTM